MYDWCGRTDPLAFCAEFDKNPFTGEIERGTSAYRYRWENNQGDILYVDENSFDPNRFEEYNTREWKRSEVWDRKK